MRTKYHSKKVTLAGKTFDSKKESLRYRELLLLERAGAIQNLQMQVRFELIPSQRIDKKVVEDTKGFKTKDYVIKRKLMLWVHGIRIREV